jgi:hypothetical protein
VHRTLESGTAGPQPTANEPISACARTRSSLRLE